MSEGDSAELPLSWARAPLGSLGAWAGGGTPSKQNSAFWVKGGVPWVSPKDMKSFEIRETEDHITDDAIRHSAAAMVPAGTVLMVTRSGILRHTFPVAVSRVTVTLNQDLKALTPAVEMHPDFVAYALRALASQILHSCAKDGTTVQSIDSSALRRLEIPVAPGGEQVRVVDALDELFSDLDAGVAALERVRAKLKLYRAAVLKAAVEGALTVEWRAQYPAVEPATELLDRILAERRRLWEEGQLAKFEAKGQEPPKNWKAKYGEPSSPDSPSMPLLPDTWCWTSLDQCSSLVTSGSRGWREYYSESGATFVRSQDIRTDRLEVEDAAHVVPPENSEGTRTQMRRGDLLVTITGANVGKAALVDVELPEAYVSQHVGLIRLVIPQCGKFLHAYAVAPSAGRRRLLKAAYGAGKPGLNLDNLRELPVPLPPLAEQEAIVELVEDQMSVIDHLEAGIEAKLKGVQSLRQAILRHAFSGNLVPQDPNDEPASELLKRIAAEREARSREMKTAKPPGKRRQPRARSK